MTLWFDFLGLASDALNDYEIASCGTRPILDTFRCHRNESDKTFGTQYTPALIDGTREFVSTQIPGSM